jgi:hypothetical protein
VSNNKYLSAAPIRRARTREYETARKCHWVRIEKLLQDGRRLI